MYFLYLPLQKKIRCISPVLKSQGLKGGLKAVYQVKTQEDESGDIEYHKRDHPEFVLDFGGEIVVSLPVYNNLPNFALK